MLFLIACFYELYLNITEAKMYPIVRLRRNRRTEWLRDLTAESSLRPADLILPIFVEEGQNVEREIKTMPGVYAVSIDKLILPEKHRIKILRQLHYFP
jgi:delta-aminolevulinic acid dehydratase/porphobilinogen synthase